MGEGRSGEGSGAEGDRHTGHTQADAEGEKRGGEEGKGRYPWRGACRQQTAGGAGRQGGV